MTIFTQNSEMMLFYFWKSLTSRLIEGSLTLKAASAFSLQPPHSLQVSEGQGEGVSWVLGGAMRCLSRQAGALGPAPPQPSR